MGAKAPDVVASVANRKLAAKVNLIVENLIDFVFLRNRIAVN